MSLTTTEAPFIEEQKAAKKLFIEQPYHLYSDENHETWRRLFLRMVPQWEAHAHPKFREGLEALALPADRIPRLEEVNRFLQPRTGFRARAVAGYVPAFTFFDCLRNREFPTTITIRRADSLDYLPEPDIFHDVAGHVPLHTDPHFAETLVRFGECAHTAADLVRRISGTRERLEVLSSIYKAMARFFWFTIEFGLMRADGGLRVYGSGLLSSFGEIRHAVESPDVQRSPLQLDWVIHQGFEIHHYQPLLFYVDSFEHLYSFVDRLEQWMKQGKLNHVAPGEPEVKMGDLESFLTAGSRG